MPVDALKAMGAALETTRSWTCKRRWAHGRDRFYDLIGGAPHLGSKQD